MIQQFIQTIQNIDALLVYGFQSYALAVSPLWLPLVILIPIFIFLAIMCFRAAKKRDDEEEYEQYDL